LHDIPAPSSKSKETRGIMDFINFILQQFIIYRGPKLLFFRHRWILISLTYGDF
jgi:hypothetical protein